MQDISKKEQAIINVLLEKDEISSSDVHARLLQKNEEVSLVTVKRYLSDMVSAGLLHVTGSGPATAYRLTVLGRIAADVDPHSYIAVEPDRRYGMRHFNAELFSAIPDNIFSEREMGTLEAATQEYTRRIQDMPQAIQDKELERLIIELAWKSSKIEGNTYTLLDTEKLIRENIEAPGHSKDEAHMILNHKEAFLFVKENLELFSTITRENMEKLHAILVKDLSINEGLRQRPVGITGSTYVPLDNIHQIQEAIEGLSRVVTKLENPYAKALVALLGISYIQPFDDGNKRTYRLMANAILLANNLAPLSYRSVEENEYKEAMLVFYELNVVAPFRTIFVEQYDFAARNYLVT